MLIQLFQVCIRKRIASTPPDDSKIDVLKCPGCENSWFFYPTSDTDSFLATCLHCKIQINPWNWCNDIARPIENHQL